MAGLKNICYKLKIISTKKEFEVHCDEQIRILISIIENEYEMKDLYEYWQHLISSKDYDEEAFLKKHFIGK